MKQRTRSRDRAPAAGRRGRLGMERLEERRVLSANAFIYGIADDNKIWEVNVAGRSSRAVFDAQPIIGTGASNAFAYDNTRSQFFFIDPQNSLQLWDRGSTLTELAGSSFLGLPATGSQPCNAAYYADAYWYFTDGTSVLNKVAFTYVDGVPTAADRQSFVVGGGPTLTNTFGDIAINAVTGILYASTTNGAFYAVNLAAPATGYSAIKPPVDESPGLQLAFSGDYGTLYGQGFVGGQWYTVDTATGANTPIVGFTTAIQGINGLRDIGGSADTPVLLGDLAIAKTDGSSTYVPGQNMTYTITTTNLGPDPVTGARVSDRLPAGTTFVSATGGATYNPLTNTVRYTTGTLASGASESFTLTILPASSRRGSLLNTATVASPPGVVDPTPANNTASDLDTILIPVDLSVTKTDGSPTYVPGQNVTYTVTVGNAGPRSVTGAVVTDVLPTGTTFVSATGGATYNALTNTVSYTTGTLAVGGTTSFTLTILPASSRRGSLSNTAAVTAPAGTIDLVPANNTASDTDTVLVPADLSVTKTDGSSTYVPGQNVTYTITTTNNGPDPVTGAVVTDVLPTGTTFVSATGGATYNALTNTVSYSAGTLAVGGTTSFTLTILPASSRRGSLSNTAAVTAPAGTIDLVPANNTASDTDTALVPADLSVTKTDGSSTYVPGQNVTYTITTTNNGPDPVTGAVVTDVLPTGTTFVSATGGAAYNALTNTVSYTAGTLAVGGTTSFTLTILPASSRRGSLSNTARVTAPAGTIDLVPGNNTASDVNTVVRPVDLWVTKTDGSSTYVPGETVTYTVTVGNAGPRVATGAVVTDVLPTGTTFVSATGGATYSALTNTVSYTTGTLAVGGQETFTISILPVASRQGSLSNTATVTAPAGMIDLVPANNSASDVDAMRSTPLLVASSDLGCDATPLVTVIDPSSGETRSQFSAYEPGFRGGLRSAVGDLDGDAVDEIVVAPGPGRAGEIRVFTLEGVERTSFRSTPFGAAYGQGIEVSVGDVNGDGRDDIVAAKSRGAGEVTVLSSSGTTVAPLASFVAFPSAFNGGATVTVADMGRFGGTVDRTSTDGIAEILVGSGPGMAPTVLIYSVIGSPRIVDGFMPLSAAYQGGFSLSAQRFNTDAIPDVLVAAGRSAAPTAVVYDGVSKAQLANYAAFASLASATAPVFAALADVDGDGRADDVFMTQGTGSESRGVRRLSVATATASTPVATALLAGPMRIATRGARR